MLENEAGPHTVPLGRLVPWQIPGSAHIRRAVVSTLLETLCILPSRKADEICTLKSRREGNFCQQMKKMETQGHHRVSQSDGEEYHYDPNIASNRSSVSEVRDSDSQGVETFHDRPQKDVGYNLVSDTKEISKQRPSDWLMQDTWLLEIIALIFSILAFAAIGGLLRGYEGKPFPNLAHGLTLNTIVSVLATASKSALIFVVAASIGQLKWLWFREKNRSLSDMQSFDDASRGPMGSLIIMIEHRGWSLVSLGALITILALAFDPFVQQILSYPVRQRPSLSEHASVKQAHYFLPGLDNTSYTNYLYAGLWTDDFSVTPSCSTGNCTWSTFQSVGLCSACEDLTSVAQIKNCDNLNYNETESSTDQINYCYIEAGNGTSGNIKIQYQGDYLGAFVPTDLLYPVNFNMRSNPYTYSGMSRPIAVLSNAQFELQPTWNLTELPRPIGVKSVQQCAMSICLKTYNVIVSSGTPSINVTSIDHGVMFHAKLPNATTSPQDSEAYYNCWKPNQSNGSVALTNLPNGDWVDPTSFAFCPTNYTFEDMNKFILNEAWFGYTSARYKADTDSGTWKIDSDSDRANDKETYRRIQSAGLDKVMANVASAFTKFGLETGGKPFNGTAMVSQTYVAVSWPWLILPALLILGGVALFVATAIINRNHKLALWKSSILPVVYHAANQDLADDANDNTTVSKMEKNAREVQAKLDISDTDRMLLRAKAPAAS